MSEGSFAVDKLVHEPARLAILSLLDGVQSADFQFVMTTLGLTKGNLSSHLSKLADAGLIQVTKVVQGNIMRTTQCITPAGHQALQRHWEKLDAIRRLSHR